MELVDVMGKPLLVCLILTGMHVYFGLHVVTRGVIFVDLAMAQVAALGSAVGFLFGFGLHSSISYWISLALTFFAAYLFSAMHSKKTEVPEEAYIGIVYVLSAALLILFLSFAPDGGEELKAKAVGHLLFVNWSEIWKILFVYLCVAFFHWFFRARFIELTFNAPSVNSKSNKLWHFLFYASFGVVVSCSVEIAGVLLVFGILIIPVVCAVHFKEKFLARLLLAWVLSFASSTVGILVSYFLDLPTGATVITAFGGCLVLSLLVAPKKEEDIKI